MTVKRPSVLLAAVMLASCAGSPSPAPASSAPSPAPSPAPIATPAPRYADTLRIGGLNQFSRGWTADELIPMLFRSYGSLVYGRLYRWDATDMAVPDLADGACTSPGSDPKVIRCRLISTTFQDGTPVTADDVAYTFDLFLREPLFNQPDYYTVRAADVNTVEFTLSEMDPTLVSEAFPMIPIVPRHAVEAADTTFTSLAAGLRPTDLEQLETAINDETNRATPVCSDTRLKQVDALLARIDTKLYREDYTQGNGAFDACTYLQTAAGVLGGTPGGAAWILSHTGLERAAGIFRWAAYVRHLPGAGPYRYVSQDADAVHFEAWAGYHGGLASTRFVDIVRTPADGSGLTAGSVDILPDSGLGASFKATAAAHGITVATPPSSGFYTLTFNVRPGQPFADRALRRALQLCIDLPADVDAATGGNGTPIASPVLVGSWASNPAVTVATRDTTTARVLIEAQGWTRGAGGVYTKGGARLAAKIVVREDKADRVRLSGLVAAQARDCGMDLQLLPLDWDKAFVPMLSAYPHVLPGTKQAFDLMLIGWSTGPDPADGMSLYGTDQVTTAEHPDLANVGGFSDPALDKLLTAGLASFDPAVRAPIYRQAQEELASQVPAIFLWASNFDDAVRNAVTSTSGPLDFSKPNWAWQPERLVVIKEGTP